MRLLLRISGFVTIIALAVALLLVPQQSLSRVGAPQSNASDLTPAYHNEVPTGDLPATMNPDTFGDPIVQNAYTVAARVKKVLYQEPCYCHCDRSQGHASLLDCFVSKHGSGCDICVREDLYTYEQTKKGKSAAQIREGIKQGEWKSVDVSKYETPIPAAHK